ncbi:GNAT family N-acetyltransferase [Prosthecomicrobium sp. N25]|uniref:GNAT family N-acetyltransferase n=1 Tax=Prosthecomicrobium sp. N25 TaxID=3129254 RepID=UPI00307850C5
MTGSPPDAAATLTVAADGYTDLPPGILATLVTYLEMTAPVAPRSARAIADLRIDPVRDPDLGWYRRLYALIGEPWLWFSRRALPDADLRSILTDPSVEVFVLRHGREEIGLLELDGRVPGEIEIAFFGLVPEAIGSGVGRHLMNEALRRAWARQGVARVWLHTCAFDHPDALAFYRRSGFVPVKFALEIGPDPRLTGILPRTAAPQVPLIG